MTLTNSKLQGSGEMVTARGYNHTIRTVIQQTYVPMSCGFRPFIPLASSSRDTVLGLKPDPRKINLLKEGIL